MSQESIVLEVSKDPSKKHFLPAGIVATINVVLNGSQRSCYVNFYYEGMTQTIGPKDVSGDTTFSATFKSNIIREKIYCSVQCGATGAGIKTVSGSAIKEYSYRVGTATIALNNGGYHKPGTDLKITFSAGYNAAIDEQYTITHVKLFYKENESSSYQFVESTSLDPSSATIPGAVFEQGKSYNSYAIVTYDDGYTETISLKDFYTFDGTPKSIPVYPVKQVTYENVNFQWLYSVSTGMPQYAFDIQISLDNSNFQTIADHIVSDQNSYAAKISNAGTIYWRIRSYNQDNVASEWSDAVYFVNNIPPSPPNIVSISKIGRPEVRWSASDQIAYRVRVLMKDGTIVFDSKDIYSTEKKYQILEFLDDGSYVIQVRVTGSLGKNSEWASADYSHISELPKPIFSVNWSEINECIEIMISSYKPVSYFYLIRSGKVIAKFTDNVYEDYYANGNINYRLIAVASDGGYGYADLQVRICCPDPRIVLKTGKILKINKRIDDYVKPSRSRKASYTSVQFFNSSVPRHLFSSMKIGDLTVAFFDSDEIADNLLGEIAYYADPFGNSQWYAITSYSISQEWVNISGKFANEVTLTMEETEGKEGIPYEA